MPPTIASRVSGLPPTLLLRLTRSVFGVALLMATGPLWFPSGESDFPIVPTLTGFASIPISLDELVSSVLVLFVVIDGTTAARRLLQIYHPRADIEPALYESRLRFQEQISAIGFPIAGVLLVLLNQHRFQPWFYHFMLLGLATSLSQRACAASSSGSASESPSRLADKAGGWVVHATIVTSASIYLWSAWSRLDAAFLQTYGQQFVEVLLNQAGLSIRFAGDTTRQCVAALLPAGELLVGLLLLLPGTRRTGLLLSALMHVLLMLAVGPLGFDHRLGVLLWNGYFIVQNSLLWMLLRRDVANNDCEPGTSPHRTSDTLKSSYLGIVLLLPALHEGGLLDHWPAWSVYSASAARVHVLINKEAVSLLPDECLLHVQDRGVGDGWQRLRLDRWSLHAVDAPIYPDARFQLAVAASILTDLPAGSWVVVLESQAGRLSGERTREKAASNAELRSILRRYWINTTVRSSDRRHQ